jgi:hypothetical protein
MPKVNANYVHLTTEPFIRVFSNSKTGCKIKKIAQTHKFNMGASLSGDAFNMGAARRAFNMGKRFSMGRAVKRQSTFGTTLNGEINYLLHI